MTRTNIFRLAALVALGSAASAANGSLAAQELVRGTIAERAPSGPTGGPSVPIEGAMVVLLAGDSPVASQLSDADGSFRLVAPRPGRYEIRVDRIGYGSTYSAAFDVAAGATVERHVEVDIQPIMLGGLDVSGSARCESEQREGAATALVWEEARKALAAATWTADRELYRFRWTRYVRDLADDGRRVLGEQRTSRSSSLPQPFRSMHPDTLAAYGFVREMDGIVTYLAPDANVLLSDSFVDAHCLALTRRSDDGQEYIGLRFEPVAGRELPEVAGVLWLDTETGRLTSLEYEYVNYRPRSVRGRDAHGRLSFQELPNGTWIVDDWSITMPRLVEVRDPDGLPMHYRVDGYAVEGGTVADITTRAGVMVAVGRSIIEGIVTDSVGLPVEGARVWVQGTEVETRSGPDGAYTLRDLGRGVWSVRAAHPMLSRYGHPGAGYDVAVGGDETLRVRLDLSSIASFALERCGTDPPTGGDAALLVGSVVDPAGAPVPAASVRAVWTEIRGTYRASLAGLGTQADEGGAFLLCGVPRDRTVVVSASHDETESGSVEVTVPAGDHIAAVDVALGNREVYASPEMREEARGEIGADARADQAADVERSWVTESAWLESTGYSLRRERALGRYSAPEIVEAGFDSMTRMLSTVARLEVRPYVSGGAQIRLHSAADWRQRSGPDGGCPVDLYLNGNRVEQRQAGLPTLRLDELMRPRDVTAVEVFEAASAPVGDPGACGAVLLWVAAFRDRDDPLFRGVLDGRVAGLPEEVAVTDVRLRLLPGDAEAEVDDAARFSFGALPPALYLIEAEVPGWGTWAMEVDVRAGSTAEAVIEVGGGATRNAAILR